METISKEELDAYLESIGGLENGYFSDRPSIKDSYFFSVGPGWYGLIKNLIQELIDDGWDKQICQVKEKFGQLRFYTNGGGDNHYKIISKYEDLSSQVCETCGEPGELQRIGWWKTVCEEHKKQ